MKVCTCCLSTEPLMLHFMPFYRLKDGFTALICAAQQGHVEIVQYLLNFACLQACPAHKVSSFLYITLFTIYGALYAQFCIDFLGARSCLTEVYLLLFNFDRTGYH